MYIVVLVLGVFAAVAGALTVLFGLSIKEFSFGSTLLITGTTAFVGGLIMVAVGGAIRELHRIAQALNRPVPAPRFPRPGEPLDPYAPGNFRPGMNAPRMPPVPPAPMPPPQGGPEGPARDRGPNEPRLTAAVHSEPVPELTEPSSPSLQPQEQQAQTVAEATVASPAGPPAEFGEPDVIPLSPDEAPRAPAFEMPELGPEPAREPEPEAQPVADHDPTSDTTAVEPEPQQPPSERERSSSPFDAIWPPRERTAKPQLADEAPEPQDREAADREATATAEDAAVAASSIAPDAEPSGAAWQPADAEPEAAETNEANADAPQPVSILKSGVVDGMAYTLYSDGSIEAQLPDETIRFASITELRMHLEKTG